jgi:hypothetical protein
MPYILILNHLDGVELLIKALDERAQHKGCIASADLSAAIATHTLYQDETGKCVKLGDMADEPTPQPRPKLRLAH